MQYFCMEQPNRAVESLLALNGSTTYVATL